MGEHLATVLEMEVADPTPYGRVENIDSSLLMGVPRDFFSQIERNVSLSLVWA